MKIFILGILFVCLVLPIVEDVTALIHTLIEYLNSKIGYKIYLIQKEIQTLEQEQNNPESTSVIGFSIDDKELEEEDQEDTEEDRKGVKKK